jgi:hypothetical protein
LFKKLGGEFMYFSLKSRTVFAIVAFSICGLFVSAEAETVTKPHLFIEGELALASEVNDNFDVLYNIVNELGKSLRVNTYNGDVIIGTFIPETKSMLRIISDEESAYNIIESYGGSFTSVFMGMKARGTRASPAAVQDGDVLTHFGAKGFYGENPTGTTTAGISFVATETYSATNRGSKIVFLNTPNNSAIRSVSAVINPNGNVGIGTTSPQSTLQINGYTQLALTNGIPPGTDCNDSLEHGRMKVDASSGFLYICVASGWVAK